MFVAFRIKGYIWFWTSMFWSSAGMSGRMLAQGWLVLELTDENSAPLWLGVLAAVRSVGSTLLSPFGGIVIDRFDRRHILVVLQMFNMSTSLVLGTLVVTGWVALWHVIGISLLQGLVQAVSMPARNALTFDLAGRESLLNAMSANYLAGDIMRIFSPVIAGVITDLSGTSGAFFFLAGSFIVATYCVMRLPPTEITRRRRQSVWASIRDGVGYASKNPNMRVIMILDVLMSIFAYSSLFMLPVFARDVLGVGATGLGVLMGLMGVGSVAVSTIIASSPSLKPTHVRYFLSSLGYAAAVILWAVSPWYAMAAVFLTFNGVMNGWFNSISSSLVQVAASDEYRARMIGLQGFTWGTFSLGGLTTGAAATLIGVPAALAGIAAIPAVASIWFLIVARRYSVEQPTPASPEE